MSLRGSGALGLRSGLVPLKELLDERQTERTLIARCAPQRVVPTSWELVSGHLYRAPWVFWVHGSPCEVAGLSSRTFPEGIPRVATLAELAGDAGWWYDLATLTGTAPADWDDPEDIGGYDGAPWLYVDLGSALSPEDDAVAVAVDLPLSSRHADVPVTLDNVTPDGNFEDGLGDWTATAGSGTIVSTTPQGYVDTDALFLNITAGAATTALVAYVTGDHVSAGVTFTPAEAGQLWVISGFYNNAAAAVVAVLRVSYSTSQYLEDGRHVAALTAGLALEDSKAEWRYFEFVIRAKATTGHKVILGATKTGSLGASTQVLFDAVQVRPLIRYVRAHGRLEGAVTIETGSSELVFGGKSVGVSGLTAINTDGALDYSYRALSWPGAAVRLEESARARSDGVEALSRYAAMQGVVTPTSTRSAIAPRRVGSTNAQPFSRRQSEYRTFGAGWVESVRRDGDTLAIEIEELRTMIFGRRAAPNRYTSDMVGEFDERIVDTFRPLVMGDVDEVTPNRVDKTDEGDFVGEVADPTLWPTGIVDIVELRMYADAEAAGRRDETLSLDLLKISGAITKDLPGCGFSADTALKPFILDSEHEYFSFTRNGTTYHARLMAGTESFEVLSPTADGGDLGLPLGAPTQWQALLAEDGARVRGSNAAAANEYVSVVMSAVPASTSIMYVEVHAIVYRDPEDVWVEGTTDFVTLYLKKISTGDRYISDGTVNGTGASSSGSYWPNPYIIPAEVFYRWDVDPSDGQPWTVAKVAAFEAGVRYRKGNAPGVLFHDRVWTICRVFLATPPTASAPGMCIPLTLAERLQAEMRRLSSSTTLTVTWDNATKKLTVADASAATLTLLTQSGRQKNGWGWLGFATDADQTGALTYTAAQAIYIEDSDIDSVILRARVQGYKDDADGTYTGRPGTLIVLAPDVLRFLAVVWFKLPAELVDDDSFVAARGTVTTEPIAMLISDERTVRDIFDSIESSSFSDIVFVADSYRVTDLPVRLQFRPFTMGPDGATVELLRDDFISLSDVSRRSSVAAKIEASFGRSMALKGSRFALNLDAPHVKRQTDEKRVETDFRNSAGAQAVADFLAPLLADPRLIEAECCKGSLSLLAAGDKIIVSYSRLVREFPGVLAIDSSTGVPALPLTRELTVYDRVPFRLVRATHSKESGRSSIVALKIEE